MTEQATSESIANAMRKACAEARKWLGATAPNPPVGAVALDKNGQIIAATAHHKAGESHAEAKLIEQYATRDCLNAIDTLCVTLEPCNHHGHTPPCVDKIIQSGIKHVAIGTHDPNPHVRGGGTEKLRQAGIEVLEHVEENECRQLIHAFTHAVTTGKPWITVKQAHSPEGSMLPPQGQKTFTSPQSLILAHRLRKKAGAILTGSGTILADNPLFTIRNVPDFPNAPRRILAILDRRKRIPESYLQATQQRGFEPIKYDSLDAAFADLAQRGIQDILVEAGPSLSQAILQSSHWTMRVKIQQSAETGKCDQVTMRFNPNASLPFAPDSFNWEWFLPA